ncbi:MAG: hypothetical protein KKG75_01690 [Nanoarchaeota archaeon]|nr:hypothetical protein [Nanoarchaeota archaeon]
MKNKPNQKDFERTFVKSVKVTILILIVIFIFSKSAISISGSSSEYDLRISLGSIASNASTETYNTRIFSDYLSANITSNIFGRLSINSPELFPSQPELYLPLNDSFSQVNSIIFQWYNVTDSNRETDFDKITYLLEVYNDSALTAIYYREDSISETSFPTSVNVSVNEDIILYWRVLATDSIGLNSSWSEVRTTGVDTTAPTSFNLLSPTNATTTTDNTPSFSWTPTTELNLDNYTIELSTSEIYITPNYTQKATATTFSNWTIQLPADTYFWKVIAYDKASRSNESAETFTLTISAITTTTTVTVSTGETVSRSGGVKQKPFNLDIIAPPSVTIYSKDQVIVPLVITNPANEIVLKGISLNVSSDSGDVDASLAATYIPQLRPKEQITVPLTIITHTDPGSYGITITASILNPSFTDSVKIYANLIEKDTVSKTQSSKQIAFAKELFNGNPACLELNEYITQAELSMEKEHYDQALNLAENAIQSCKDLLAFVSKPEATTFETYIQKVSINRTALIIIVESLAFIIILLFIFKLLKKKK